MSYQVLARKWRPKSFAQLVGQEAVVRTLSNALKNNRLHHAYLFTGTRGVGKTTIARIIAKCLNCEHGISATPCNQCDTCLAIDRGQFVDLLEVDAASRTKVEDTRELLDNVQYAPTQGRYKIYLIDEVHMLSGHSFNALLKTLEEPPEHVKFLLATTDPQKLPITVLSRCLQFHLKGINPDVIATHLADVLQQEKITFEAAALQRLGEAAKGSMRDALSLLDQCIAFSDANVTDKAVEALLGTTPQVNLYPLLDALLAQEGNTLLTHINELSLQGVSFSQVLNDFLALLHNIAMTQTITAAAAQLSDAEKIKAYADSISTADIQLYYQIGIVGQRDLPFAPSARSGFEMTLLRMLSFAPVAATQIDTTQPTKASPIKKPKAVAKATTSAQSTGSWDKLVGQLNLGGMTKVLAQNCALHEHNEQHIVLQIDAKHASLANDNQVKQLEQALSKHFGKPMHCKIEVESLQKETPAAKKSRQKSERRIEAVESIHNDPHVQDILQTFGGSLDEKNVTPLENS